MSELRNLGGGKLKLAERKRIDILSAAVSEFQACGFNGTSMDPSPTPFPKEPKKSSGPVSEFIRTKVAKSSSFTSKFKQNSKTA